jgi:GNAT superfamily N-acetyltransferase
MDSTTLRAMQTLSQEVWRHDPALVNTDASLGELAWSWRSEVETPGLIYKHRVWMQSGSAAAWGYIVPSQMITVTADRKELSDASLIWQAHPSRSDLLDEVLDWLELEVPDAKRRTAARAADNSALERFRARGYAHDPSAPWHLLNARSLDDIAQPILPSGYVLKTMRQIANVPRRVAVHRAAWEPSSVTEDSYARVMSTWPYRDDLDFVVEAPDGSLAASALGWYDDANRVGEFEPVGTHPEHRRLGLARAVLLFGMQCLRDAGAEHAIIGCRGDDAYPVPKQVYESIGFRELSRDMPFVQA